MSYEEANNLNVDSFTRVDKPMLQDSRFDRKNYQHLPVTGLENGENRLQVQVEGRIEDRYSYTQHLKGFKIGETELEIQF